MTVRIRVSGVRADDDVHGADRQLGEFGITAHETIAGIGLQRGSQDTVTLDADESDVLRVEYDNGFVDFVTAREVREQAGTRRGAEDGVIDLPLTMGPGASRGVVGWVIDKVQRLSFDPPALSDLMGEKLIGIAADVSAEAGASALALYIERKFREAGSREGPCLVGEALELVKELREPAELEALRGGDASDGEYLVLLHGTFSSTQGAFKSLVDTQEWRELRQHYGERIISLEHRTLSENPVQNALALVKVLPMGAQLHLISHSRGGLIGDLLSLPGFPERRARQFQRQRGDLADAEVEALRELVRINAERGFQVRRFVRVASPSAGTILASGRLDDYLKVFFNLLKLAPPLAGQPVFAFVEALVIGLAGKRAEPRLMPGLEAMMPESPYMHLLNATDGTVDDGLAVVAGDVEGSGLLGRLKVLATDLYYREDHDLVVNTRSMYLGLTRTNAVASFQKGAGVEHTNYFANEVTRRRIVNALLTPQGAGPDHVPRGFLPLTSASQGVIPDNVTRDAGRSDARLVFVPAQLASELTLDGGRTAWPHPSAIADLGLLDLTGKPMHPQGVAGELYQGLIDRLAASFQIELLPYDWRSSYAAAGKCLAQCIKDHLGKDADLPIHIVAHSAGGFAVLWVQAHDRETWRRLRASGGRAVLLGLPAQGSFAVLEWLTGQGGLPQALALLDPEHATENVGSLLAGLPGLRELLPRTDRNDLLSKEGWSALGLVPPKGLRNARELRDSFAGLEADEGVHQVAGVSIETTVECHLESGFLSARTGDGFAFRSAGSSPNRTWFTDATHAGLADERHADAIRELLEQGTTTRLQTHAAVGSTSTGPAPAFPPVLFPTRADLVYAGVCGEPNPGAARDVCSLKLEVLHASLEQADYPVFVGHYEGTPIEGAEGFIDQRIGGMLTDRQVLGRYAETVGDSVVLVGPGYGLEGVVVVGYGPVGELSPPRLVQAVRESALAFALQMMHEYERRNAETDTGGRSKGFCSAGFASVLMGTTGRYGLSITSSVTAIVQGAIEANSLLEERGFGDRVRINAVQLVERYADTAETAAEVVRNIESHMRVELRERFVLEPGAVLVEAPGGVPGQPGRDYEKGSWSRLVIEAQDGGPSRPPTLEFTSLGRRARAEMRSETFSGSDIDAMIRETITSLAVCQTNNTLFELLVPNDFKHELSDGGNRVLVVDETSARYPWELLATKDRDGRPVPLVDRVGILRQFKSARTRAVVEASRGKHALVIGDPDGGPRFPHLPHAAREAAEVADVLRLDGYEVTDLVTTDGVAPRWLDIENALFEREYRVIHIAAHGLFDPEKPESSGVVIGDGRLLTAGIVRKLRVVPELVFLNCCHLGRTDPSDHRSLEETRKHWNYLAASISRELMEMGVRAVIAAGWAVDDQAARAFATQLYRGLFAGAVFGDAVDLARGAARAADGGRSNTWGAYQCYGDPSFRLARPGDRSVPDPRNRNGSGPVSRFALLRALKASATRAGDFRRERKPRLAELAALENSIPPHWRSGEVDYLLGRAFSELGEFGEAGRCYTAAIARSDALAPIEVMEQMLNMDVRQATMLDRLPTRHEHAKEVKKLLRRARNQIRALPLIHTDMTSERWAIIGSFHRKRATTLSEEADQIRDMKAARRAYRKSYDKAIGAGQPATYPFLNWVMLSALLGVTTEEQHRLLERTVDDGRRAAGDLRGRRGESFWSRVALPDALLAREVARWMSVGVGTKVDSGVNSEDELALGEVSKLYSEAFDSRSTYRERGSVLESLGDLVRLAPAALSAALDRLYRELEDRSQDLEPD